MYVCMYVCMYYVSINLEKVDTLYHSSPSSAVCMYVCMYVQYVCTVCMYVRRVCCPTIGLLIVGCEVVGIGIFSAVFQPLSVEGHGVGVQLDGVRRDGDVQAGDLDLLAPGTLMHVHRPPTYIHTHAEVSRDSGVYVCVVLCVLFCVCKCV